MKSVVFEFLILCKCVNILHVGNTSVSGSSPTSLHELTNKDNYIK